MNSEFRELKVIAKVQESSIITSFYLKPVEPSGWRDFAPGQFLVFRIPMADRTGHVLRNYSLSGPLDGTHTYRISVKREPASASELPVGYGSGYLHDCVDVGDKLIAEGPRGDFVLDKKSLRPVVLLSGGVGLTPMVAMLHNLARRSDRRVTFLHACENGDVHALREEVIELSKLRYGISVHFCYRSPTPKDLSARQFHTEGVVSKELLQNLLCLDDYDFYLCGPPPFMQAVYGQLSDLGVIKSRVAYEFFGPATVLEPSVKIPTTSTPHVSASGATLVEFRKSGVSATWDSASESLLSFAEDQGLSPEFSCRAGICGTCRTGLLSGSVTYFEDPLDEVPDGYVLLCCSKPNGAVELDA